LFGELINYDKKLISLNFLALLSIIFLPFSTGFIAANFKRFYPDPLTLPFVIYMLNIRSKYAKYPILTLRQTKLLETQYWRSSQKMSRKLLTKQ